MFKGFMMKVSYCMTRLFTDIMYFSHKCKPQCKGKSHTGTEYTSISQLVLKENLHYHVLKPC